MAAVDVQKIKQVVILYLFNMKKYMKNDNLSYLFCIYV